MLSYNRFLELKQKLLFPLLMFFSVISAQCDGTSYIDSTHIPVYHIKRELLHKVFKGIARKSKSTMDWFFGFKLHMIVNSFGHPISFNLTFANCDDRKAPENIFSKIFGKLFGDKGYIGKLFFDRMKEKLIHIITSLRRNMNPQIMTSEHSEKLNKRGIIESTFNILKNVLNMKHRSPKNFGINLISAICAFSLRFVTGLLNSHKELLVIS